ncbi:YpjP family protein [Halobacillus litoralis]|uniref:YpjP family protein n=1 Tax=Halobacillus litoralis TaxID=45668 RepID=UPI001CD77361|nr:YpjP family protein [Halobacillus litoralis]MCA0971691.1 YpjP family protein [Halobacillus litoralis]
MTTWGRKLFVILVSVLTLGLYIPPTYAADAPENKEIAPQEPEEQGREAFIEESVQTEQDELTEDIPLTADDYVHQMKEQAKEQTLTKMGPRIIQKVDRDMTEEILPKIEEIVDSILDEVGEDELPYYEITEELTPGYGEKIFTVINHHTGEELARFDVRRDKRPGDGYWFNFHYHLQEDNFAKHHAIGEIYWEKNTPPKWMS